MPAFYAWEPSPDLSQGKPPQQAGGSETGCDVNLANSDATVLGNCDASEPGQGRVSLLTSQRPPWGCTAKYRPLSFSNGKHAFLWNRPSNILLDVTDYYSLGDGKLPGAALLLGFILRNQSILRTSSSILIKSKWNWKRYFVSSKFGC